MIYLIRKKETPMNETKEMELKYLVDDNFDIIGFVLYLVNNGFTMEDLNYVTNEDIYFDTPDKLLQRTDSSLRIRIIDEKKIKGTLKYPVDNDSLYMQRIEIEKDLESKTFDALLNAFNNEKFDLSKICPFPFLRLFNSRHDFTLKNGENIITLSFDILTYNETIQELMIEIEAKKTTNPKVLEDINELIKRKYDLKTTKQSKYQRGIELTKIATLTRKHQ